MIHKKLEEQTKGGQEYACAVMQEYNKGNSAQVNRMAANLAINNLFYLKRFH